MSSQLRSQGDTVDVVVVGGGHCGLATSYVLSRRGVDHVVLERGEIGNSWRTERWDSLRLLTPNWMTRLPGQPYRGDDPDGYMTAGEVVDFVVAYARQAAVPVQTRTTVQRVERRGRGYRVETDRGELHCRAIVIATGAFSDPVIPRFASAIPAAVDQFTARDYRNPAQLGPGGVLVVGAAATGLQLAHEIAASGRRVTLAVGEHVRMPRLYRGRDIQWWMHASGLLDQRIEEVDDPMRARGVSSPQLVGTPERLMLDLDGLQARGVELVGRFAGVRERTAQFSGSLRNVCALADLKMNRLLDALDDWAERTGLAREVGPAERYGTTTITARPRHGLGLGSDIKTVIWATGFRPRYPWLDVSVLGCNGELRHDRGVVAPGMYVLGLPYLRRRKSSFIHGAEDDVNEIANQLVRFLDDTSVRGAIASTPALSTLEAVTAWALDFKRDGETELEMISGLAELLVGGGLPLVRVSSSFRPVDPIVWARNVSWTADRGVVETVRAHGTTISSLYKGSAVELLHSGSPAIRERLELGTRFAPIDAHVRQQATDYYIQPIELGRGLRSFVAYSLARPGGFTDAELALLDNILPAVSSVVRLRSTRMTAGSLLRTYLGPNAAARVLEGTVQRGTGERIAAAIWFCDLRDFTVLSQQLPADLLLRVLDDYFQAVSDPIADHGGEVLKFIGDAVMAVFPVGEGTIEDACARAAAAAVVALERFEVEVDAVHRSATGLDLGMGIALHFGEVFYGNIGARDRLDFTVIGPAVNLAARVEGQCSKLGTPLLMTEDFTRRLQRDDVRPFEECQLKGIACPTVLSTLEQFVV